MAIDAINSMLSLGAPQSAKSNPQAEKAQSPADAAKARAEAAAARQKSDLNAVREKGIYAWAQEQKLKALEEKIRQEMEKESGGANKIVAGSDPATWSKDETSFEAEVARRMKNILEEAMGAQAQKAAAEGKPAEAMIIDISV